MTSNCRRCPHTNTCQRGDQCGGRNVLRVANPILDPVPQLCQLECGINSRKLDSLSIDFVHWSGRFGLPYKVDKVLWWGNKYRVFVQHFGMYEESFLMGNQLVIYSDFRIVDMVLN
jgi:hypothetical protein